MSPPMYALTRVFVLVAGLPVIALSPVALSVGLIAYCLLYGPLITRLEQKYRWMKSDSAIYCGYLGLGLIPLAPFLVLSLVGNRVWELSDWRNW